MEDEKTAEEEVIFVRKATGLVRTAGVITTAAIAFGYLTQGITYYPAMTAFWFPGSNMLISYAIGGFIMVWPLLIAMFFVQAMPRSASDYVAVSRVIHPSVAYIGALIQWQNWAWVAGAFSAGTLIQAVGQAAVVYGKMVGDASLVEWATPLATFATPVLVVSTVVGILVLSLITIVGWRWSGLALNIMFAGMLVGVVLGTGILTVYALQGQAATAAAWDRAYGAGAWQEIRDVAIANGWKNYVESKTGSADMWGWPGAWNWSATFGGALPASYAWWGMEIPNQVAGEIKEPSKTYPRAAAIILLVAGTWYILTAWGLMAAFGEHFPMYAYVIFQGYGSELKHNPQVWPMVPIFTGSLYANPYMAAAVHLLTSLNLPSGGLACFIITSRVIFALSFDRAFPSIFAKVNERWRTPHYAVALTSIYTLIWVPVTVYLPYVAAWNVYASAAFRYMIMGWAAMIMPYKFPGMFERAYAYKIGKIPVLTILGVLGTITATWLFVNNLVNIYGAAEALASTLVQVFWLSFSIILWASFYNYYKSKGIDMDKLYASVPPA